MRSETAKKILSETSEETKDKAREYSDLKVENSRLHSEIREFKLLVREYFQAKSKIRYTAAEPWDHFDTMKALEKRILSELERFTAQDVAELPFGSEEDILP